MAQSGDRTRIRNNLSAIRLLRTLDEEQRSATTTEQQTLARWSGWGAVPAVFDTTRSEYSAERAELLELFSAEEYDAARTNTLNAHYTDAALVQGIWQGMRDLGFDGGNVLEPGCGSGNFLGFAPRDTPTSTHMVGVEQDPITAAIARYLYPDAQVLGEDFAETIAPAGSFDSAVGNVPFGNFWLYDPRYNPAQETIHNHFLLKSVEMTKPGGVVAAITTHWTMDSENTTARSKLAAKADLLGAVRLPRDAHAAAAGTRVVTDVLFLRRRESDREPLDTDWVSVQEIEGAQGVKGNSYFADHPEHIVGEMGVRMGRFGPEVDVVNSEGPLAERFAEAVGTLTAQARARGLTIPPPGPNWQPVTLAGSAASRMEGLMQVDDEDRLTQIINGIRQEIDPPFKSSAQELFALLRLRDTYLELVEAERTRPMGDESIEQLRVQLNERYDAYVATYGPMRRFDLTKNGRRNPPKLGGLKQDLLAHRVLGLEHFDPETQTATRADIFTKRTIAPPETPDSAATPADALAISLDTYGEVRLEEIQRLLGSATPAQAREALGTLVYTEPVTERLAPAPEYLSGDVRTKIAEARVAAATDERFTANVEALAEVIPDDLTPAEIEARLGASWISAAYVQQFAREVLDDPHIVVTNGGASHWMVNGGNPTSVRATQTWGTPSIPAQTILQNVLQNKSVRVTRTVEDTDKNGEPRTRTVLNMQATEAAQAKVEELAERFAAWVWEDPDRARDLAQTYNARHNALALRTYTGEHLTLAGLSQDFVVKAKAHQRAAVARVLAEPATLLAHGVGAGKTAEMVISVMEMRRLGQCRKPAMVVPNHMLEQFSREFSELYPQAKILVADKDMMSANYRSRFADMAASGDWDAIIFGHHQFKNLPLSNEERGAYEDRQVAEYEEWIASARDAPGVSDRTVKQLEKAKVQLQNRYRKLMGEIDAGSATLEDCGIDALVVDEAHEHKNALVRSNIQDAAKMKPADMAEDLMMKADYIRKIGGKLVFATATPIANSVSEAYVIIRFLRPDLLHKAEIKDFDQWASTFGEIVTEFEMKPEGGEFQQKDRFSRFTNVPELLRLFHTFADIKLVDELGLDRPTMVRPEHRDRAVEWVEGRENITVPASQELLDFMKELGSRADDVRAGDPQWLWSPTKQKLRPDNMLWISSDGQAAALDPRLVGRQPEEDTKIQTVAEQVHQIWDQHKDDVYYDPEGAPEPRFGSVQLVFCDLGTPSTNPSKYDAYADLRQRLVAQGLPHEQIRFIHEAATDKQKADLFESCRDGRTQVIIGSTKKMGTGTNIQRRAVALHHVDCPWRPVDIEQREGRLIRQGNPNSQVRVLSYVTEGSFDAYMWQTALRKIRFIEQIMRGKLDVREIEDISSNALSYAEVQAAASGNPLMLERAANEKLVRKLERAERQHHQTQEMLTRTIAMGEEEVVQARAAIDIFDQALQQRVSTRGDAFRMVVGSRTYDKRADAANVLRAALNAQVRSAHGDQSRRRFGHQFEIGELGGFRLSGEVMGTRDGDIAITVSFTDLPSNKPKVGTYATAPTVANTFKSRDQLAASNGHGIVLTLENTLLALDAHKSDAVAAIPRVEAEIVRAREEVGKPFARAELEAALEEEKRIRKAMGMPPRRETALGEDVPANPLEDAVQYAVAADVIAIATAGDEPSRAQAAAPVPRTPAALREPRGTRPLGSWRTDAAPRVAQPLSAESDTDPSEEVQTDEGPDNSETTSPVVYPRSPGVEEPTEEAEAEETAQSTEPDPSGEEPSEEQPWLADTGSEQGPDSSDAHRTAHGAEQDAPAAPASAEEPVRAEGDILRVIADGPEEEPDAAETEPDAEPSTDDTAPEGTLGSAPDDRIAQGREVLRSLRTTFDPQGTAVQRAAVVRCADFLAEADRAEEALELLVEANRLDPSGGWGREERRSRLAWHGEQALNGSVIRIEHDGAHTTLVRGTSKEDMQVLAILNDLKFKWSGQYQMWYLPRRLNATEQKRRVNELLTRLDAVGRDRIAEPLWQEINERSRNREHADSRTVIEQTRPGVEEIARQAHQDGAYRRAIIAIDETHRALEAEGHYHPGEMPGTGERPPFADERDELVGRARERIRELKARSRALLQDKSLENLREVQAKHEEMALAIPPEDATDARLESVRSDIQKNIERAQSSESDSDLPSSADPESEDGQSKAEEQYEPRAASTQGEQELGGQEGNGDSSTIDSGEETGVGELAPATETGRESDVEMTIAAIRGEFEDRIVDEQMTEVRAAFKNEVREAEERVYEAQRAVAEVEERAVSAEREAGATRQEADAQMTAAVERAEQAERQAETAREELARVESEYESRIQETQDRAAVEVQRAQDFEGAAVDQADHALKAAEQAQHAAEQAEKRAAAAERTVEQVHVDAQEQIAAIRAEAEERVRAAEERAAAGEAERDRALNSDHALPAEEMLEDGDTVEEAPHDPTTGEPLPPGAHPMPGPRRRSIDIAGAEPYPHRKAAERATWWISEHGLQPWKGTATAVEFQGGKSLPPDDSIALDHALVAIDNHGVTDGPSSSAIRFAELEGAAAEVAERITVDRQHLAQLAEYAADHVARLKTTREYNHARRHGVSASDLARIEATAQALRYTSAEEAEKVSMGLAVIANRWATTATGAQLRGSTTPQDDMVDLRHAWSQVASEGLTGGPGPTSFRFERVAECATKVNERLTTDAEHLRQVAEWAHRHAGRLEATRVAHTTSAPTERETVPVAEKPRVPTAGAGVGL